MNPTGRTTPSVGSRPTTMGKDVVGSAPLLEGDDPSLTDSEFDDEGDDEEDDVSTTTRSATRREVPIASSSKPGATGSVPKVERSLTSDTLGSLVENDDGDSDSNDDNLLTEEESFMVMTKAEHDEWEKRMEEHQQTLARKEEEFKNWNDKFTRRRMFAYARIKKLEKHFQSRTGFFKEVKEYVTHTNAMHDRLLARAATVTTGCTTSEGGAGLSEATPNGQVSPPSQRLMEGSEGGARLTTPHTSNLGPRTGDVVVNGGEDVGEERTSSVGQTQSTADHDTAEVVGDGPGNPND